MILEGLKMWGDGGGWSYPWFTYRVENAQWVGKVQCLYFVPGLGNKILQIMIKIIFCYKYIFIKCWFQILYCTGLWSGSGIFWANQCGFCPVSISKVWNWSEQSACSGLGCWHKRRWPLLPHSALSWNFSLAENLWQVSACKMGPQSGISLGLILLPGRPPVKWILKVEYLSNY